MRKQRRQPQPGVTAWRATLNIALGQPRRRCSFKLLWHDQLWFYAAGILAVFRLRLEQLPLMFRTAARSGVADQILSDLPDRFARKKPSREAGRDKVAYYHHAAGHDIVRKVG